MNAFNLLAKFPKYLQCSVHWCVIQDDNLIPFFPFQCDFFVLNKDSEECHIGERIGATSLLSEEPDKREAYVDVGKK